MTWWIAALLIGASIGYLLASAGVFLFALALVLPLRAAGGRAGSIIGGLLRGAGLAETGGVCDRLAHR